MSPGHIRALERTVEGWGLVPLLGMLPTALECAKLGRIERNYAQTLWFRVR